MKPSREQMITAYLPLVKYVANRIPAKLPPHMEREDLISYGIIGLMDAWDKFDPSRGIKFETYASRRIRGAILDALRQNSWVPRSVVDKLKRVNQAFKSFEGTGEEPSEEAVASEAQMSVVELRQVLAEVNRMSVDSLEQFLTDDPEDNFRLADTLEDPDSPNPEALYIEKEMKERLATALSRLNERDHLVLSLYYHEGLTLKEIGAILEVSESRVSQLHARALLRLKYELEE
ncbi:MAG TPA: FliA/WhiG family RNA polymerase sigma factor [Clostridia bacterium]|nr:FliA/WhiG family RNA polymerase sigma factor [Clostridia bacterium]